MNYLTLLNQTVRANLDNARIGTPLFVRWTASIAQSPGSLPTQLAEMSAYVSDWLAAGPVRLYATGTEAQGHLSLALNYDNGSSALLALTLAHSRPHIALAIYGNQGALYHNDFIAPTRDGSLAPLSSVNQDEDSFEQARLLFQETIEQSLAHQAPITLAHAGGQS